MEIKSNLKDRWFEITIDVGTSKDKIGHDHNN
jgi:hypothetical protein